VSTYPRAVAAGLSARLNDVLARRDCDYSELEFDSPPASRCSRLIRSSSFARVSCRNSSASAVSEVVNGPVGGAPRKRLRSLRRGFTQESVYVRALCLDSHSNVFARRAGGRLLLKARGAAKSRHAHCSPELRGNKVGSLTTDRHHTFQFRPAHAELLDERRVRFDGPSTNRFEHLVDPICPICHGPHYGGSRLTAVFAPRAGGCVAPPI
jgi:hypothetical protein